MSGLFARQTKVDVRTSHAELQTILAKYRVGAANFVNEPGREIITFPAHNRMLKFVLPISIPPDEQKLKADWRSLNLLIKGKLEAVRVNIMVFEQEFFAYIVQSSGKTIYEEEHKRLQLPAPFGS